MLEKLVVKISGGIGNQLFQLAFGISLARRLDVSIEVDKSSFVNYNYHHEPEIHKLQFDFPTFDLGNLKTTKGVFLLKEENLTSINSIPPIPDECNILILDGYWQSEQYLDCNAIDEIYNRLHTICHSDYIANYNAKYSNPDSLALHIRRRDYAHMGVVCGEYYLAVAEYHRSIYKDGAIVIFSDEPNYSMSLFSRFGINNVFKCGSGNDLLDLFIMSRFKNVAIANSTYSWWGARFAEEDLDKCIVRPDPWLPMYPATQPCPERWQKLENSLFNMEVNTLKQRQFLESLKLRLL